MVKIKPFKGIRPPKNLIEQVASRPYDLPRRVKKQPETRNRFITSLNLKSIFPKERMSMIRVCMRKRRRTFGCFRKKAGWCRMRSLAITFMPKQ